MTEEKDKKTLTYYDLKKSESTTSEPKKETITYYDSYNTWKDKEDTYASQWWKKDYGKKKEGESVSSYWKSKFDDSWSYGSWSYSSTSKSKTDFEGIINSIRRSANVVTNSSDNEEKSLGVQWKTGPEDVNRVNNNKIFLSPEVVDKAHTKRPEWSEDERSDVLIGEVLTQATLKRTVDLAVENKMTAISSKRDKLRNEVWTLSEHLYAEKDVLENYPGFKGYFASVRDYYTGKKSKENFEKLIEKNLKEKGKMSVEEATAVFSWNILHPEEKISVSNPDLDSFLKESEECFMKDMDCAGRAEAAEEIIKKAYEKFLWSPDEEKLKEGETAFPGTSMCLPDNGSSERSRGERSDVDSGLVEKMKEHDEDDVYSKPSSLDKLIPPNGIIETVVQPEDKAEYLQLLNKLKNHITAMKMKIKLRVEEQKFIEHALKRGRIDEGSLYKLAFSRFDYQDSNIFEQEEIISLPDVAFGILVDESGSMGAGTTDGNTRAQEARDICIIMAEALRSIEGVKLAVWGHTADCPGWSTKRCDYDGKLAMHDYYSPDRETLHQLARIAPHGNNMDGYAMAYSAKKMNEKFPSAKRKILVHISDGQPSSNHYSGSLAIDHMRHVCDISRREGVKIIGLGVGYDLSETIGRRAYGAGNFVYLNSVKNCQTVISNIIKQISMEK